MWERLIAANKTWKEANIIWEAIRASQHQSLSLKSQKSLAMQTFFITLRCVVKVNAIIGWAMARIGFDRIHRIHLCSILFNYVLVYLVLPCIAFRSDVSDAYDRSQLWSQHQQSIAQAFGAYIWESLAYDNSFRSWHCVNWLANELKPLSYIKAPALGIRLLLAYVSRL